MLSLNQWTRRLKVIVISKKSAIWGHIVTDWTPVGEEFFELSIYNQKEKLE